MTEWKSLEFLGFDNYEVSSEGNVRNVVTGKLIKPQINHNGYYKVCLCNEGEHKRFLLHRLVALTFIPNEGNLPQINHINQVKTDNRVDNLEWCNMRYNLEYSKCNSPVSKYNTQGELLCTYWSVSEAARCNGLSIAALLEYLNGHLVSDIYYGFIYRYEGQSCSEPIRNDEAIERKREADRLYKLLNKERKREYDREYRQRNKERIKEYKREYRQTNKERIKEQRRQYRLRKKLEQAQENP